MKNDFFVERSVCPICGSKDAICILSIPFDSDVMITYLKSFYNKQGGIRDFSIFNSVSYELMQCGCCSLIYQKFIPDDNLMYKLYEEFIDPEIKKREVFGGKVNLSNHNRLLSKEIEYLIKKVPEKKEPIKFLDYGMGWGLLCKVAISYKCDTYGTELSTSKIE